MLLIRLELALLAAIFIATYAYIGGWAGIAICVAGLVTVERAARTRQVGAEPQPPRCRTSSSYAYPKVVYGDRVTSVSNILYLAIRSVWWPMQLLHNHVASTPLRDERDRATWS